nr:hypothetical protein [Acidovorax sp. 210-6]
MKRGRVAFIPMQAGAQPQSESIGEPVQCGFAVATPGCKLCWRYAERFVGGRWPGAILHWTFLWQPQKTRCCVIAPAQLAIGIHADQAFHGGVDHARQGVQMHDDLLVRLGLQQPVFDPCGMKDHHRGRVKTESLRFDGNIQNPHQLALGVMDGRRSAVQSLQTIEKMLACTHDTRLARARDQTRGRSRNNLFCQVDACSASP